MTKYCQTNLFFAGNIVFSHLLTGKTTGCQKKRNEVSNEDS